MRFKLSAEIFGIGAIALTFLKAMKTKRRSIVILFATVCVVAFIAAFLPSETENKPPDSHNQKATTSGGNSPAINQSAATSGNNSPVIQVAPGAIVNYGVSESAIKEILKQKAIEANTDLIAKYPQGYILLGLANGKIIYEPKLKQIKVDADWNNATLTIDVSNNNAMVTIPSFSVDTGRFHLKCEVAETSFRLVQDQPVPSGIFNVIGIAMYYEVIDVSKKIFVIGFR